MTLAQFRAFQRRARRDGVCHAPVLPMDRALLALAFACLAVSYALAGLVALGWWP